MTGVQTCALPIWVRAGMLTAHARSRVELHAAGDRGDVPGWVLVAVMTAGLVTALWLVADGQLTGILTRAISSVSKP
mgnify:CR=1 FL=1